MSEMEKRPLTRWTKTGTVKNEEPRHASLKPATQPAYEKNPELKKELEAVDKRVRMVKGKEHLVLPSLNQLYDTLSTPSAWRYSADGYSSGTVTTIANATATVTVPITFNKPYRTQAWPGAVQVYPILTFFSIAPQGSVTTAGALTVVYIDHSGVTFPLGCFISSQSFTNGNEILIPSPITDSGITNAGQLQFTLTGTTTPSTATYSWQVGFSSAYLLPAQKGYTVHEYDHWKEEYQVYEKASY